MNKTLTFLFVLCAIAASAQFNYKLEQSVRVEASGKTLSTPWVGGLNAAQYNTIDLNNDQVDDLVLYDRMADRVITFINKNNEYLHFPSYENQFPPDVTNWMLLRDFNCDGKKDIFTGDDLGIKVFINASEDENLVWKPYLFYSGLGGPKSKVLLSKGFAGKINLQLQFDDLPSISDADGDGDLDIFSVRFGGNATVEFHKNFSQERYGVCDSLDFERISQQWGGFTECGCENFAFNNELCSTSGGRTKHAGGKSLLTLDLNGDAMQDLLISEGECTHISALVNEGDENNAVFNSATGFPSSNPINFELYPAVYLEDVNFDGKSDLIASPNIFIKDHDNINLAESNWLYKNIGTNESPQFSFEKTNFLQEDMIDVGDNAVPAFFDIDADNDMDLLISNNEYPATIFYYQNVGNATEPSFRFISSNYLNFSSLSLTNLKIQFGDLNNDGKSDLIFSGTNPVVGNTKLFFVPNQNQRGTNLNVAEYQEIDFALSAAENVLFSDINGDGKLDIVRGRSNGTLELWENTGSTLPSFKRVAENYLNLGASVLRQNISAAAADLDGDGKTDIVLADQTGELRVISNFKQSSSTPNIISDIIYDSLSSTYGAANLGGRIWPTVVNLFNSARPSIVVGTSQGGLRVLKHASEESSPSQPRVELYPNPIGKFEVLKIMTTHAGVVQLYSIIGHEITSPFTLQANQIHDIPLPSIAAGIYLARFTIGNKSFSRKIVIQ